jgi:hypothetical protein
MEKAKEAHRKERLLVKQREEKQLTDQHNPELTGFVMNSYLYILRKNMNLI